MLTRKLRQYLNSNKIIIFAGFSVGADPNSSQCTVPSSIHCGGDISLLQSVGDLFEWVNVMANDAGQELDVQVQWAGFSETAEQLAAKAAWQKQNNYGGGNLLGSRC